MGLPVTVGAADDTTAVGMELPESVGAGDDCSTVGMTLTCFDDPDVGEKVGNRVSSTIGDRDGALFGGYVPLLSPRATV